MKRVVINKYIVADPEICHGKPTFKGSRVMVWQILEMLAAGESIEEIMENYPSLTRKQILAALDFAATRIGREKYVPFNQVPPIAG